MTEAAMVHDADLVDVEAPASCRHVNLAILALAVGGFAKAVLAAVSVLVGRRQVRHA